MTSKAFELAQLGDAVSVSNNGEVGIGTGSDTLTRELTIKKNDQCDVAIVAATNQSAQLLFGDTDADNRGIVQYDNGSDFMAFTVAGSERARIDSSGGISKNGSFSYSGTSDDFYWNTGSGDRFRFHSGTTSSRDLLGFSNPNGVVGSIETNGSSTSYNTSSDYRLKENVADITDPITRVKQLSPKRFNFIADADAVVDGFIAHEAQSVVPEAITGTKDEVDADGNPVMQGIDQGKLVPLLTAALQEAITKIETLETKVAALEAE